MASTTRGREVFVNQLVHDQVDYFLLDGFTRATGLTVSDIALQIFFNNSPQNWNFLNGAAVSDSQVVAGNVYFHEVSGQPGIYNVRWRPTAVGYWRTLLTYTVGQQIMAQDFDVRAEQPKVAAGLRASFSKPSC